MRNSALSVHSLANSPHPDCLYQAYFSAASDLHAKQIKAFLNTIGGRIRRASEEESEQGEAFRVGENQMPDNVLAFSPNPSKDNWTGGLRRAGTVRKERDKSDSGNLPAGEVMKFIYPLMVRKRLKIT